MPKVSIVKCENYDQHNVHEAVNKSLDLIGGLSNIIKPGDKVLIKPNILMGVGPDHATTTHPSVVAAIINEVKKAGGIPFIGDSPGNAISNYSNVLKKTGIQKAVDDTKSEIVNFSKEIVEVKSPSNNQNIPVLHLTKAVFDADVIISAPKLKSHNFTLFTGAVKNMFGAVPGFHKGNYHSRAPKPEQFSEALVDILEITKPQVAVMDAIVGMEGPGPANGIPRKVGLIIASYDLVALDSICAKIIGYDPAEIDHLKIANKRKLGEINLSNIDIIGEEIGNLIIKDFKLANNSNFILKRLPSFIVWLAGKIISKHLRVEPVINPEECTYCQVCIKSCPVNTIEANRQKNAAVIKHNKCIMCFCCHELCEFRAITIRRSWLAKMMSLGNEN